MRLVADTRMERSGGIGTYIKHLVPFFELEPLPSKAPIYSFKEQIDYFLRTPKADLLWVPHFNGPLLPTRAGALVTTLHDLYHLDHLSILSPLKKLYAKTVIRRVVEKADQIITVSNFSKGRIAHHFPHIHQKVTVIPPGADHLLSVKPEKVPGAPPSFFLFVGTQKAHKNYPFLKEALAKRGVPLVATFERPVSDAELAWLYTQAEALIFPSLYEGWGLPPLEAMSLGCPVLASNRASIPEACSDGALYFDPTDETSLLRAIDALPEQRARLVEKGRAHASNFTWKKAAEAHLEVFERALAKRAT
jgi:glycosyltransferase involved in cell wall biosynthesis